MHKDIALTMLDDHRPVFLEIHTLSSYGQRTYSCTCYIITDHMRLYGLKESRRRTLHNVSLTLVRALLHIDLASINSSKRTVQIQPLIDLVVSQQSHSDTIEKQR